MVEEVIPGNTGLKNVEKTSEFESDTDIEGSNEQYDKTDISIKTHVCASFNRF